MRQYYGMQYYGMWTWTGVFVLIALVMAGCATAPAGEAAAPGAVGAAPAASAGNGDVVEGWGGGYEVVPPKLCPPVKTDEDVDARVRPPIFQEQFGEEQRDDRVVRVQRGLYANEQGEVFLIEVVGMDSPAGEEAIRAYSNSLRVCFDQILVADVREKIAEDKVGSPMPAESAAPQTEEEVPDPAQIEAESLVIVIQSVGFVPEGDVPGERLQELLQKIVNEFPPSEWESALHELVPSELDLPFASTDEWTKENQQDLLVDFIIDPAINNGVRHQYAEVPRDFLRTTVDVDGSLGAGRVAAGLCRAGAVPFATATVDRAGSRAAELSGTGRDLGVVGRRSPSKYRMTGRWYRHYDNPAPAGSAAACNP